MIKITDYNIHDIYQGSYSSMDPNKSYGSIFIGYSVPAGELGAPTKPDTANQIQQVNMLLNQGIVPVEFGALDPKVFDQIPKEHFKEINRMMKLTGGKVSVHAPIIEASGVTEQGWSESNREFAEKQLIDIVKRSHELDPSGGMPITIHSTGLPGVEYGMTADGKKIQKISVIERESGKIHGLEHEERFYPGMTPEQLEKGGKKFSPEERMKIMNASSWDNSIDQLFFNKERADEILNQNNIQVSHLLADPKVREAFSEGEFPKNLTPTQLEAFRHLRTAEDYIQDVNQNINLLFSKAYKYGSEKQREKLKKLSTEYGEDIINEFKRNNNPVLAKSNVMHDFLIKLKSPEFAPEMYVPVEQFALQQASETFANVALKSYETFKDKAPTISIENMFAGMAFGLKKEGEGGLPGMNELILETKHKFVENAIKSKDQGGLGISKSVAEKQADKMIGMTLDVGHLNIAKKSGFKDEDLAKEVAAIAKHVKHVHLTDNFGYSDSHLPPGMGNVPFKKILEELEKAGTLGKSRKIVEAAGWPQHFGSSPLLYTLAGMGSEMVPGTNGPSWGQTSGLYQGYFGGMGMMLPQVNYQTFGAGFSKLPTELGGQMPGAQGSRLSGTPME